MIKLRDLKKKDAPLMLEWMHEPDVQKWFKKDMKHMSIGDVENFIADSKNCLEINGLLQNAHFAIVQDCDDEYLGTVSLKDIDYVNYTAEYAIVLRKKARGSGIAFSATGLVLKKAFNELGLHRVYLSVYASNTMAIRLYEKIGFTLEGEFREHIMIDREYVNWKWYGMLASEFDEKIYEDFQ